MVKCGCTRPWVLLWRRWSRHQSNAATVIRLIRNVSHVFGCVHSWRRSRKRTYRLFPRDVARFLHRASARPDPALPQFRFEFPASEVCTAPDIEEVEWQQSMQTNSNMGKHITNEEWGSSIDLTLGPGIGSGRKKVFYVQEMDVFEWGCGGVWTRRSLFARPNYRVSRLGLRLAFVDRIRSPSCFICVYELW